MSYTVIDGLVAVIVPLEMYFTSVGMYIIDNIYLCLQHNDIDLCFIPHGYSVIVLFCCMLVRS